MNFQNHSPLRKDHVLLIDPPTFPKGVLSLGLAAVAAALPEEIEITVVDLNLNPNLDVSLAQNCLFVGIKVSSQNFTIAKEISEKLKLDLPSVKVIWGGELPTILPKKALEHCDCAVLGSFEPIAKQLVKDLRSDQLQSSYDGRGRYNLAEISIPNVSKHFTPNRYYSFMGIPMETSRGCDRKCTFCMVHIMQNTSDFKPISLLKDELDQYAGHFINVVDYNIAVNREHVLTVAAIIAESQVIGWMAELCLESLDDNEVLQALQKSRCKIIYCGLESLDEKSLKSVNKSKTNVLANYERIIRKAQAHNIQIAAGLILGLEGMNRASFVNTIEKFSEWGIIYTKMTFLTYNPGTKVKESMRKKGTYLTEEIEAQDGNHLSFMANGVHPEDVYAGSELFIRQFYSLDSIKLRAKNAHLDGLRRMEFILFNMLYREVYRDWLKYLVFNDDKSFDLLLRKPFVKTRKIKRLEFLLKQVRNNLFKLEVK